ncbi:hypothetical protein NQ317_013341 [Molorchus minor]|uniref:C2H2-type domain-containing protein n=1 Tax=Molorchus minor TaxID=1323400 RepID=A0ABQ9IVN4_9CUCU|nr:hypothetical protein NQ317_013341 [Molorchus minor]
MYPGGIEYVRSWGNIFPYNSEKKNEFIKKGMAAYRAKASHMEKFPKDVITAETKLGGNPNILSEPMFLPEIKRTYVAEVFGTPSPKNKGHKDKKRASTSKSGSKDTAHITHRRFLGVDDYQAIICIQYPGKDRTPGDREDEEVIRINREQEQDFNCHTCSFTTKRLEVMILHTKSHIQGIYVPSSRKIKHPGARRKKEKSKRFKGSDDVMDSDSSSNDSDYVREKKRKTKPQTPRKSKKKEEKPKEPAVKTSSDIRSELLAVWDDSDEDEDFDLSVNKSTASESNLSQCIKDIIFVESSVGNDTLNESEQKTEETEKLDKSLEETLNQTEDESVDQSKGEPKLEDQSTLESKQSSQKVVEEPSVETTQESKDEDETLEGEKGKDDLADEAAKPKNREGILKESEKFNQKAGTESQGDDVDATFKELMEMTSVPELPDVQNTLKCEQNFHDTTDAATKLINPKKRFVKSFEDFELMQNEIRRKEEEQMESKKEPGAIPGIVASCYDNEITYDEPTVKLSMLKSKIMSKIIEEAKIDNESKHKIMSKMQESNIDNVDAKVGSSNEEVKTGKAGSSHRTPLSKILESYRNDTNKLKMEQEKKVGRNRDYEETRCKLWRYVGDIKDEGVAPKPLENEKLSEELAKVDNRISVEVPASSITGESHSIDISSDDLHKEDVITREDNHTVLSSKKEASLVEKPINKEEDGLTLDVEIATDKSKIDESEKEVGEVSVDKEEHEESFTEMPVTAEIEVTSKDQTDLRDGKNLKDKVSSHLEEEIDIEDYVKVPKDDKYNEEVLTEDAETQLKDEIDIEDDVKVPNNDKENEEVSIEDAESLLTFSPKNFTTQKAYIRHSS